MMILSRKQEGLLRQAARVGKGQARAWITHAVEGADDQVDALFHLRLRAEGSRTRNRDGSSIA